MADVALKAILYCGSHFVNVCPRLARALPGNKCGGGHGMDYSLEYCTSPFEGFVTSGLQGRQSTIDCFPHIQHLFHFV